MTDQNKQSHNNDCSSATTLSCQQLETFLVDYLDGKLNDEQRRAFEEHISLCPPCVQYVEDYKSAISLGKDCFKKEADECTEQIPEQLVSAILTASKS